MKKLLSLAILSVLGIFGLFSCPAQDMSLGDQTIFTITYISSNADVATDRSSETVESTVPDLPQDPLRNNYSFQGWWTAPDGGGFELTTSTLVTTDLTVYAHWSPPSPGLSYNLLPDDTYEVSCGSFLSGSPAIPGLYQNKKIAAIADNGFVACTNLTGTLRLPSGITKIGNYAFANCIGFTGDLILPKNCISIGQSAFGGCTGFNGRLLFGKGIETLGESSFFGCSQLTGDLPLPSKLIEIPSSCFKYCSGLSGTVTFPPNLTTIGQEAFRSCSGIKKSANFPIH